MYWILPLNYDIEVIADEAVIFRDVMYGQMAWYDLVTYNFIIIAQGVTNSLMAMIYT